MDIQLAMTSQYDLFGHMVVLLEIYLGYETPYWDFDCQLVCDDDCTINIDVWTQ